MKTTKDPETRDCDWRKWLAGGGLGAAFLASLCCVGPLLAAALGLGAFTAAGWFHQFRSLFLGIAVLFVAAAWVWDWRKRRQRARADATDEPCSAVGCRKNSRAALVLFTAGALLLGFSPYLLEGLASSGSDSGGPPVGTLQAATFAEWDVPLEGMTCPSCTLGLERAFRKLEGVESAEVTYRPQRALVHYFPADIATDDFMALVEQSGYSVAVRESKISGETRAAEP